MKKFAVAMVMVLSLMGCGGNGDDGGNHQKPMHSQTAKPGKSSNSIY